MVIGALEILRGSEGHHIDAVAQKEQTNFGAGQKFFNEDAAIDELIGVGNGGGAVTGDDNALAGCESVSFDHVWRTKVIER